MRTHEPREKRALLDEPHRLPTSVRLDPCDARALRELAEREERTTAATIRMAVREYLARHS